MITLYGNRRSRAMRCVWALNEVGVEFENNQINHSDGETQTDEYRALNPAGKVPTLVDGDLVLYETAAINLYLAQTYQGPLWPGDKKAQALCLQWTLWGVSELEPCVVTLMAERMFKPEPARDEAKAQEAEETLKARLDILETELARHDGSLTGAGFCVADLNVIAILFMVRMVGVDLAPWSRVAAWFGEASQRPAFQKTFSR